MERFQGRYRIPSNRMPGWDYSGHGIYFITLCVEGRESIFGFIDHKKMMLNHYGRIAEEEWIKSEAIRREIELDAFVIMPNHVHGIVILHPTFTGVIGDENDGNDIERANGNEHADDPGHAKSNTPVADNNDHSNHPRLHRKPKSLSSFIAGYKSSVTTRINNYIDSYMAGAQTHGQVKYNKNNRLWQPNYYDHIIRNDEEYMKIKEYIQDNPSKWMDDRFYK